MRFFLLFACLLSIFEPTMASGEAAANYEQVGGGGAAATASAGSQTELTPLNLNPYGGARGNSEFKKASVEIVTQLTVDLSEIPFYRLRCYMQRKNWFLTFLEELGKKRHQIAKKTNSTDAKSYGNLRSSTEDKPILPFGNSVVLDYPLMHQRILTFLGTHRITNKSRNFVIQISSDTQIEGKNLNIAELEVSNDLTEQFHLFLHDTVKQEDVFFDAVSQSLTDREVFNQWCQKQNMNELQILMLQEYINMNGFQIPGRCFGMFYHPSATDDTVLRQAPLSLCHPFLFPHIKAGPGIREKKGDHLLDATMDYFFQAVQEPRNFHGAIAKFLYYFAITMPYERGSAAIGEWIYQALCRFHGIRPIVPQVFSHLDQLAQSSFTFEEFWAEYQKLIPQEVA